MSRYLIPAFCFVVSAAAKGRGGSSIHNDDVSTLCQVPCFPTHTNGLNQKNWDAPPLLKTMMAFAVIFCIVGLALLFTIFKYMPGIPGMTARGPYILLSIVVVSYTVYNLLWAVYIRLNGLRTLDLALDFFNAIFPAFLPAVVLYLLHQRSAILRATKGNTTVPLASYIWKQIFDWSLVGLTFVIPIANLAVRGISLEIDSTMIAQQLQYAQSSRGLAHASAVFQLLLCIDLIASVVIHFVQIRRVQRNDPVRNPSIL